MNIAYIETRDIKQEDDFRSHLPDIDRSHICNNNSQSFYPRTLDKNVSLGKQT